MENPQYCLNTRKQYTIPSIWPHVCVLSHVWFFATLWNAAYQAPLSTECLRQKYWSRLSFPSKMKNDQEVELEETMTRNCGKVINQRDHTQAECNLYNLFYAQKKKVT